MAKYSVSEDLPIDSHWEEEVDPTNWRKLTLPEIEMEYDIDDDEEGIPTPSYIVDLLGFDPSEWGDA